MGVLKGLKAIKAHQAEQEARREKSDRPKTTWFKLQGGTSAKVRFLQELDEESPHYSEKNGLALMVVEHRHPTRFMQKAVCTADEGGCWACEMNAANPREGWHQRTQLYANVLVDDGTNEPYVALFSRADGKNSIVGTIVEYAEENDSISNRWFKITRKGTGKEDTSYSIMGFDPKDDVNVEDYELFDLQNVLREVPYDKQEEHYNFVWENRDNKDSAPKEETTSINEKW